MWTVVIGRTWHTDLSGGVEERARRACRTEAGRVRATVPWRSAVRAWGAGSAGLRSGCGFVALLWAILTRLRTRRIIGRDGTIGAMGRLRQAWFLRVFRVTGLVGLGGTICKRAHAPLSATESTAHERGGRTQTSRLARLRITRRPRSQGCEKTKKCIIIWAQVVH